MCEKGWFDLTPTGYLKVQLKFRVDIYAAENRLIEWDIKGYFYDTSSDYSLREDTLYDEKFSVINMGFIVARNTPKLVVVLLIPAFCLVILSNCALLIPVESGEKLGYSVTLLLALFIYKETTENMIPPWKRYKETPRIVMCFTGITIGTFNDYYHRNNIPSFKL